MFFRVWLGFSVVWAFASPVWAQLPAPANDAPKAAPETVFEAPAPSDEPLIVGEPVRHQNAPTSLPKVKTAPQIAKKSALAAGISIGGLSDRAAIFKIKTALAPQLKAPFRVMIGDYQYTFAREELGASLAVWPMMRAARSNGNAPLRLQVDAAQLEAALRALAPQVREDFANVDLNVAASVSKIKIALESAPPRNSFELVTTLRAAIAPKIEKPALETPKPSVAATAKVGGAFPYLLASFSTRYDARLTGRTVNLKMAARNINGTVVAPGKVFSTNAAIGPRNASAGWREAKMFMSGRVVSGTGSGICQAASTLYNAVLLADLPVVERHAHSMRVTYVPPSRDAALLWGAKDFKFRNTSRAPIKVETRISGGKFYVRLLGQAPKIGAEVRIVSQVLSRAGGTRSVAYKVVQGKQIRLSRDSYLPHP